MEPYLTLLTWPDYVNPLTLEQFELEFGVGVKEEIVPSAVELVERMRARVSAATPAPDVLCPPDYAVHELSVADPLQGAEGRLLTLDHARLPNLEHLEPRFRHGRAHDPEGRVSVVKDWGTTGFMYRTDVLKALPGSWMDFWNLALDGKCSGRVTLHSR